MEIILFNRKSFATIRSAVGSTLFKVELNMEKESRTVRDNPLHEEYRQKVVAASKLHFETNGHSICIHVKKNPANPRDFTKCLVRVHGFLEENLDSLWMEGLKIRIQMSCIAYTENVAYNNYPAQFCAEIPVNKFAPSSASNARVDLKNEGCIKNGLFSELKDVPTQDWEYAFKTFESGKNPEILGCVTMSLISDGEFVNSASDQLALVNIEEQGLARICKKILDSQICVNVTIAVKDGTVFNCNKNFLAAQSDVLAAMLETDMKEAKTNQIEMKDMSAIGVKALLEYIYTLDLDQAFENCDVALELLQAGHNCNIKSLEKQVSSIILKKEIEWFTVDMAFSLFLFMRKVDSMEDLKLKAVSVLMSKANQFMECKTYKNLFLENPAQSSEAVQELFYLSYSK